MKYLKITWIRIVISLLAGGMITEIIQISKGDANSPATSGDSLLVIICAIISFFLLTSLVNKSK